jgi:DNA-binding MarR family transcriptional regulator
MVGRERQPEGKRPGRESLEVDEGVWLGPALGHAWLGYQRLLDRELIAAGFAGRGFPDGRVLRICLRSSGVTISEIGRELGITRQAASKVIEKLRGSGFLQVHASTADGREKIVTLTPRAIDYLVAQRKAARAIERRLRTAIGDEGFKDLRHVLEVLGGNDQPGLRDYLRTRLSALLPPDD